MKQWRPMLRQSSGRRQQASSDRTGGLSVLLAEDNQINALLARTMLEKAGHRVLHVVNGQEAAELIAAALAGNDGAPDMPDLVLMDMAMPGLDGLETTRRIRDLEQRHGARCHVPILALTANARHEDHAICLPPGWTDICPSRSTGRISTRRSRNSPCPIGRLRILKLCRESSNFHKSRQDARTHGRSFFQGIAGEACRNSGRCRAAQRLRYAVFYEEGLGAARSRAALSRMDADPFDVRPSPRGRLRQ